MTLHIRARAERTDVAFQGPRSEGHEKGNAEEDVLPPFACLTTDEEWERKAGFQIPGTYYIVLNASSFAELEEYQTTDVDTERRSKESSRDSQQSSHALGINSNQGTDKLSIEDPNVVILSRFEETPPRMSFLNRSSNTVAAIPLSSSSTAHSTESLNILEQSPKSTQQQVDSTSADTAQPVLRLLSHYRSYVRRYIMHYGQLSPSTSTTAAPLPSEDLFEREANIFPPVSNEHRACLKTKRFWRIYHLVSTLLSAYLFFS